MTCGPNNGSTNGKVVIYVTLPKALSQFRSSPDGRATFPVKLARGSTVRDLIAELNMPSDLPELFFVNHRRSEQDEVLQSGADVEIFPALNGH